MPIKRRITGKLQPMLLRTRIEAWVFEQLYLAGKFYRTSRNGGPEEEGWHTSGISVGNYDDDIDLITAFHAEFYAHVYGTPGFESARRKLRETLNELAADKWIDKWKCNCDKQYLGEPTWQMAYGLPFDYAYGIRSNRRTFEGMAREHRGDDYDRYREHHRAGNQHSS